MKLLVSEGSGELRVWMLSKALSKSGQSSIEILRGRTGSCNEAQRQRDEAVQVAPLLGRLQSSGGHL